MMWDAAESPHGSVLGPSHLDRPFRGLWSLWDIMRAVSVARLL